MRVICIIGLICFIGTGVFVSYPEQETTGSILVIREGKQLKKTTVAVDVRLIEDVLKIKVETRMHAERPKITDVILVGPGIGRVHYVTREDVPPSVEEEEPYPITKEDGFITFRKRTKLKTPKGTLAKELFKLKVPVEKIVPGKRYQLWVEVESKAKRGKKSKKFKFNLENLAELVSQNQS